MSKFLFLLKKQIIFIVVSLPIFFYYFLPETVPQYLEGLLFVLSISTHFFLNGKIIETISGLKYRVNSSMDRPLTKICLGGLFWSIAIYFLRPDIAVIALVIINNLFYTYPTSRRIKHNDFYLHLQEFRFLDRFEKVLLVLIGIFFFVSAYRLDIKWPHIFNGGEVSIGHIFYFFSSLFFYCFSYSIFRYFFNRRTSLLGVFALVTNWNLAKYFYEASEINLGPVLSIFLIWGFLWTFQSMTYRSGILIGMCLATFSIYLNDLIFAVPCVLGSVFYLWGKNSWYRTQWLKYALPGLIIFFAKADFENFQFFHDNSQYSHLFYLFRKKAFNVLFPLGVLIILLSSISKKLFGFWNLLENKKDKLIFTFIILILFTVIHPLAVLKVNIQLLLLFLVTFGLIPIDYLFYKIGHLRDYRSAVTSFYLLVSLLDSHLEERVKVIFAQVIKGML